MAPVKWIAYVGPVSFPWGQPGSRRVYGVARALVDSGYRVVVAAGQRSGAGICVDDSCSEIYYEAVGELSPEGDSHLSKLHQALVASGKRTVAWLNAAPRLPSFVVTYGGGAAFMHRIRAWCQEKSVPLIVDVVEWYNGSHMLGGYFGPFHVSAKLAMHYYYPKCDGVLVISELLADYYARKGRQVLRVPPIVDVLEIPIRREVPRATTDPIKLVYAGTPGKKDLLAAIIKGIGLADPSGRKFELEVLGPTRQQVEDLLSGDPVPGFVRIAGRVVQASIPERLQRADFSVLLREPMRFANAGFPTKFVESLANGVPVIANLTSDLGKYLHDGVDGFVCEQPTAEGLADALRRALALSGEQRRQMREQARLQAESSFDYRQYAPVLADFLVGLGR